jgi:hypothetical protein
MAELGWTEQDIFNTSQLAKQKVFAYLGHKGMAEKRNLLRK